MNPTPSKISALAHTPARDPLDAIVDAPREGYVWPSGDPPTTERTSVLLRRFLAENRSVKAFSVDRIVGALGADRFEPALMLFSLPAIVPVPSPSGIVEVPTGAMGLQLALGRKKIELPRFILKTTVSRRALAVAIHALLPVIEAAEKMMRPRWGWATRPSARRAVGMFVFLLAVAIGYRVLGFATVHATSIFLMSLGMAEQDGVAVMLGAGVGVLSLAIVAASVMSGGALRAKAARWLRAVARKLTFAAVGAFLERKGYERLARIVTLQWSDLLLLWNPERRASARAARSGTTGARRAQQAKRTTPTVTLRSEGGSRAA